LPRWLIDASPVGRTTVPTSVPVTALAVMAVVAAALILVAGWIYRNRDAV
jgi:ABC-2 type transport system permease protein